MVIDFNAPNAANGTGRNAQTGAASAKRDATLDASRTPEQTPEQKPAAADSSVKLSDQAVQLKTIEERLKDLPEVDSERVAQIKQAISNGSYQMDSGRIADKLMTLEG
ncbi:MAG TPA: flagellar biosynthesis anti-sigma factor FlgM [Pseudomonas xinjiangensis]|uniref:Negative regulator of flagellin synthesis n=2 Tax=root TaxID=1 RepID=A0A7V1BRA7_9GAMM|nr:flagellar biosynthesis anti-sigma factor FlgM [Halopseudomonas xinjiangensis]HEC46216.1 flagellar biosynthesis anti-sigma factor FlgM [Halopseudomonas xinjiangensis]